MKGLIIPHPHLYSIGLRVELNRNRIILSLCSLRLWNLLEELTLFLDHLIFLIIKMVLKSLILEMNRNRNRIIDPQEKVIGVDHASMIPARRDLLYSGATISIRSLSRRGHTA